MNFEARDKIVAPQYLPMKSPLMASLVWYLVLCQFNTPEWLFGAFYTLTFLMWIVYIVDLFRVTYYNPFTGNKDMNYVAKDTGPV